MTVRKKISQVEARRLAKRVAELEHQEEIRLRRWGSDYPGGTNITTVNLDSVTHAILQTAQTLQHRLIVKVTSDHKARIFAVPTR